MGRQCRLNLNEKARANLDGGKAQTSARAQEYIDEILAIRVKRDRCERAVGQKRRRQNKHPRLLRPSGNKVKVANLLPPKGPHECGLNIFHKPFLPCCCGW